MLTKFLIRIFSLDEHFIIWLIISGDIILLLESDVIKNIRVEIAESKTSSSCEESNDDTSSIP